MRKRSRVLLAILVTGAIIAACGQSDASLSADVKAKLTTDETLKEEQIDVDTKNKVVILSGTVNTQVAKERALTLARETRRVADVVDQITVKEQASVSGAWPPGPGMRHEGMERERGVMSDESMMSAVKARLMSDAMVGALRINVDAHHGVVSLSGRVGSEAERQRAIELARQTSGVMQVKDELEIAN